jgi:DtxR family Mn-dependent transcriptional regulator
MAPQLTESLEDYLEAIAELIADEGHAHSKDIAGRLHVTMPSVTGALRQLEKMGYIVYNTHYPVQLTREGKVIADEVIRRHNVLKRFFSLVLGLPGDKATATACRLEHAVDTDTIQRFILFSEAIESRSDAKQLQGYLSEAMSMLGDPETAGMRVLTGFANGEVVRVKRFGRNLRATEDTGLRTEDVVSIEGPSLDGRSFRLVRDGLPVELPTARAENIWAVKETV